MLAAMERLPDATRRRHLALLHAGSTDALRARLEPNVTVTRSASRWTARFAQPSLDARDSLAIEFEVDPRAVEATRDDRTLTLRARGDGPVAFTVRVSTTGAPLTPLARDEIFTSDFLASGGDGTLGVLDFTIEPEAIREAIAAQLRAHPGQLRADTFFDPRLRRIHFEGRRPVRCTAR